MAIRVFSDGDDLKLEDNTVGATVKLDDLNKGNNSAHHARHESGGDDEISLAGFPIYASDLEGTLPSHHTTHESGGADEIDLSDYALDSDLDEQSLYITSVTTHASHTLTPVRGSTRNIFIVTALGDYAEFQNVSGLQNGDMLLIRVKDSGSSRALTYTALYDGFYDTLPAATTTSKTLYMLFIYNSVSEKLEMLDYREEA